MTLQWTLATGDACTKHKRHDLLGRNEASMMRLLIPFPHFLCYSFPFLHLNFFLFGEVQRQGPDVKGWGMNV